MGGLMRSTKNISALFFLLIGINFLVLNNASATVEAVIGGVALKDNANLAAGLMPTGNASEIIISRDQYVVSYNKDRRSPNWVAWKVEANQLGDVQRANNFLQDSDLTTYLTSISSRFPAVDPHEFQGSCFDRGHQIPSADRTDTIENNQATFLMSNMIPQTPYLNRVIWEHLEHYTRELVRSGKKVYVFAGPIYDQDFGFIGPQKDIPVPSKEFKVLVVLDANQTPQDINQDTPIVSVIMPNTTADGSAPLDHALLCNYVAPAQEALNMSDWEKYKTTLPEIEKASGFSINILQNLH